MYSANFFFNSDMRQIGNLASRKTSSMSDSKSIDHVIIDQSAGMRTIHSVDLRFDAANRQIRDGAYPLHMAVSSGAPLGVIEMLIKDADDVVLMTNKYGETPLHLALMQHDSEVVQVLIGCGPDALRIRDMKHGNLPIHTAAVAGLSVHVAKYLIETWPESIHEKNADGLTPLDIAAKNTNCSEEVLRLLEISDHAV
jgi:ankyrin repeat protein